MSYPRERDYLFSEIDIHSALGQQRQKAFAAVDNLEKDCFLLPSEDQLVDHFVNSCRIEPLTLHQDHAVMDQIETKVEVNDYDRRLTLPGTEVTITIPYTGDPMLWRIRPSPYLSVIPSGSVTLPSSKTPGSLILRFSQHAGEPVETFKHSYESSLKDVRFFIEAINKNVADFNSNLPNQIRSAIQARRGRLERHEGISTVLNIPLRHREGAPDIHPIRVDKRITIPLPPPPKSGLRAEPGIVDSIYEAILKVIKHEGRTFETTPRTYAVHDEEGLRDILLAHLNGHFEGAASGETFRKAGKTDIRIEDQERAAFVAECKVWRGQKELGEGIDQLLGYLTWRDCKAALVVFNKDVAAFSFLLEKMPEALSKHPFIVKDYGLTSSGEWRYLFRSQEDPGRQVMVHAFLFNLFIGSIAGE